MLQAAWGNWAGGDRFGLFPCITAKGRHVEEEKEEEK